MENKDISFQDFVRKELGVGWVIAFALGVGLLISSMGRFMQLPHETYVFNRALEKKGMYDFYYGDYMRNPKYRKPELLNISEAKNVKKLEAFLQEEATTPPGLFIATILMVVGGVLFILFFLKLSAAYHKRINELELKYAEVLRCNAPVKSEDTEKREE